MQAIIQSAYGPYQDVLQVGEAARPVPKDDEVLVRVRAASVHPDVWHVVTGSPRVLRLFGAGLLRPKNPIPGTDMAGIVEAVGAKATRFQPGDAVFGETLRSMQWHNGGAFAEYVAVAEANLQPKPQALTFEEAACLPTAGVIALHNLGAGHAGKRVLVNGAGGGVGMIAIQWLKAQGANVTGVDTARKLALLRSLGADDVVDYEAQDITRAAVPYDLVLDVASTLSLGQARRLLTQDGKYVLIGHDHYGRHGSSILGSLPRMIALMLLSPFVRCLPKVDVAMPKSGELMAQLAACANAGGLRPVVATTFPLEDAVAALRCLVEDNPIGRVVITVPG